MVLHCESRANAICSKCKTKAKSEGDLEEQWTKDELLGRNAGSVDCTISKMLNGNISYMAYV
jgi:hypothetical protein